MPNVQHPTLRRLAQRRWWPAAVAAGMAVLLPASLGSRWLAHGGLAPLAVAAVVALFLGAPIALAEWRTADRFVHDGPWGRGLFALAEVVSLLLVAAVAAPVVAALGWPGYALAFAVWLVLPPVVARIGGIPAALLALVALVVGLIGGLVPLAEAPPWTLIEPVWGSWRQWLPGAVVLGLLLTPAGLGQWATGPELPPGAARVAWATTGAALLLALASALRSGARFEAQLGAVEAGPVDHVVLGLAVMAAAAAVVARRGSERDRWTRASLGAVATLWFTGPGAAALPALLGAVVPVGLGLVLLGVARFGSGPPRWTALIAAVLTLVAAVAGPVALPDTVGGAAALALVLVAAFWYVATRAVLGRS